MSRPITADEIEAAARALISARETNLGFEISMPVIYPDGAAVTVVVNVEGGEYVVHDAGFGSMYLTGAGVKVTHAVATRLAALAANYGCEFIEGRMSRRATANQVALAIVLVANASRSVGDQALAPRRHSDRDFHDEVNDCLREIVGTRVRPYQEFKGRSGRTYRVGSVVLNTSESAPIAFVEALATRNSVNNHFTEFSDLSGVYTGVDLIAVYDQNENFQRGDLALLNLVAKPLSFRESRQHFRSLAA